jgi:glutamyl-tRNA synthetase
MKSDGYPTYNFAHIVDDLEMGVTHIFRADEFISSMPRFLALYEALSKVVPVQRPYFVSLPPIMGPDGKKKLGKRDGAKDLLDYKKDGILPSAMLNFLALIGWNPGTDQEIFTPQEFIQAFDISGIQTAGGALNEEKLLWFNKEHLKKLSDAEFLKQALPFIPCEISDRKDFNQKIKSIIPIIRERISVFKEITDMANQGELLMYFEAPTYNKELLLCPEKQRKGVEINLHGLIPHFEMLIKLIQSASESQPITKETAKNAVWDYADQQGRGIVLWALRTALSGKEKSPDPFVLLEILGTTDAVARLNNAINALHEK